MRQPGNVILVRCRAWNRKCFVSIKINKNKTDQSEVRKRRSPTYVTYNSCKRLAKSSLAHESLSSMNFWATKANLMFQEIIENKEIATIWLINEPCVCCRELNVGFKKKNIPVGWNKEYNISTKPVTVNWLIWYNHAVKV
jgi:hypothetical protein